MEKNGTISGEENMKIHLKKDKDENNTGWDRVLVPIVAIFIFTFLVILQRRGVVLDDTRDDFIESYDFSAPVDPEIECLLISDKEDLNSIEITPEMKIVLEQMKIPFKEKDVRDVNWQEDLDKYRNVIFSFSDWDKAADGAKKLSLWIMEGGHLMCDTTPYVGAVFKALYPRLGIEDCTDYVPIKGIKLTDERMIGSSVKKSFMFSMEGEEEKRGLDISLGIALVKGADLAVVSEDGRVPLIWGYEAGKGKTVIMNYTMTDKFQRGFYCLAYSMLDEACIYPVLNASSYYIDDFPSPVPSGDSSFIKRDYGVDIATFYSNIWLPQIIRWEKEYGIKHIGFIIEDYNDNVRAPFKRNTATARFLMFGNMLLNNGGELGLHGYNHQPLCLAGVDNDMQFADYKLWPDEKSMVESITELKEFSDELFPDQKFKVYVPPSNIISETGKKALLNADRDINVISSIYLPDSDVNSCTQEFGIDEENGVIETPRIVSGCDLDDYMYYTAFSELNFHYVQSHFLHPDDVLDPDRGADLGWAKNVENFEEYLRFIQISAPDIRQCTGSEMGEATLKYTMISVKKTYKENGLEVELGGFDKEASFLLRINNGKSIGKLKGCTASKQADGIYLINATSEHIVIEYNQD